MKKKILLFLLALVSSLIFLGCAGKENNNQDIDDYGYNSINLYYISNMIDELKPVKHTLMAKTTTDRVEEVLGLLFSSSKTSGYKNPFDSEINYKDYSFNNSILNLDFDFGYLSMDSDREILGRAAIVLSLLQIDGVSYVNFSIDKQPLTDSKGRIVGDMNSETFADIVSNDGTIKNITNLTLYFSDESGSALIAVNTEIEYDEVESLERLIVERLTEGPKSLGKFTFINEDGTETDGKKYVYQTLGEDVGIVSVSTKNGICYVDFDEEFIKQNATVDNDVIIYSIVNSLCELDFVNQVQISVLGDSQILFHGSIPLNDPFVRNLDIVKG